jgi:hypothetical protein
MPRFSSFTKKSELAGDQGQHPLRAVNAVDVIFQSMPLN